MRRAVLMFGLGSGVVIAALMTLGSIFANPADPNLLNHLIGYASIAVALSLVLVGIKYVRDRLPDGKIEFVPAALVGFGIAAIASVIYSIVWEVYLFATDYQFIYMFTENQMEDARLAGASMEELVAMRESNQSMISFYENAFLRFILTYMEMFVVGAPVALVGALVFKNPKVLPKNR